MTQGDFGFPEQGPPPPAVSWDRIPGVCGADYLMLEHGKLNGVVVRHCNHPTALRPYYIGMPDGRVLDRKYARADDAKAAAIEEVKR